MDELQEVRKKNKNIQTLIKLENQKFEQLSLKINNSNEKKNKLLKKLKEIDNSQNKLNEISLSVKGHQVINPDMHMAHSLVWRKLSIQQQVVVNEVNLIEEELLNELEAANKSKHRTHKLLEIEQHYQSDSQVIIQKRSDAQILELIVQRNITK